MNRLEAEYVKIPELEDVFALFTYNARHDTPSAQPNGRHSWRSIVDALQWVIETLSTIDIIAENFAKFRNYAEVRDAAKQRAVCFARQHLSADFVVVGLSEVPLHRRERCW